MTEGGRKEGRKERTNERTNEGTKEGDLIVITQNKKCVHHLPKEGQDQFEISV